MNTLFEISLMNGKEYVKSYSYYFVPNVGDHLSIDPNNIFIVDMRLLPVTDSNRVVLYGRLV